MQRIVGVLRAGADNHFVLVNDAIVMWLIGIPLYVSAVFFSGFPFVALFALMYVEDIIKSIPVRYRLGRRKWLKNLAV